MNSTGTALEDQLMDRGEQCRLGELLDAFLALDAHVDRHLVEALSHVVGHRELTRDVTTWMNLSVFGNLPTRQRYPALVEEDLFAAS